jgi:hypothetical protein
MFTPENLAPLPVGGRPAHGPVFVPSVVQRAATRSPSARLSILLPNLTIERYAGRSHLDTSHRAEPDRVASALRRLWGIDPQH